MPTVGKVENAPKVYLGIDPGASGGLAALWAWGTECCTSPMPETETDTWDWLRTKWGKYEANPSVATVNIVQRFAIIEKVHAMPGNGVSGMFKFGQNYGFLRACLIAAGIPFEDVDPRTWQKALGISSRKTRSGETKTQWKNRLKAKAQQLFPSEKVTLATADALLIAEYCRRKCEGKL